MNMLSMRHKKFAAASRGDLAVNIGPGTMKTVAAEAKFCRLDCQYRAWHHEESGRRGLL